MDAETPGLLTPAGLAGRCESARRMLLGDGDFDLLHLIGKLDAFVAFASLEFLAAGQEQAENKQQAEEQWSHECVSGNRYDEMPLLTSDDDTLTACQSRRNPTETARTTRAIDGVLHAQTGGHPAL